MGRDPAFPDARTQRLIRKNADAARSNRLKTLLAAPLFLVDAAMLVVAFVLGYAARIYLPVFAVPNELPPLVDYIPTMALQVVVVGLVIYISRLYHLRRAISRIDFARDMLGAITIGAMIVYGLQEFLFKNSPFEVDYTQIGRAHV